MINPDTDADLKIVKDFFIGQETGHFLSIGSHNGFTNDATSVLIDMGWQGVYCEPHPNAFSELVYNTREIRNRVRLVNAAITSENKITNFYLDNTSSAYSSMLKDWTNIQNLNHDIIPIVVNTIGINDLLDYLDTKFDYIQLDVEGLEADLIASINNWSHFDDCKMICFEQQMTNNITQNIKSQLNQQGNFITMYSTPHNVFCVNKKHLARDHFITNK